MCKSTKLQIAVQYKTMILICPLENIYVSELCKRCFISRTTFYNNFSNLRSLLEFTIEVFTAGKDAKQPDTVKELLFNISNERMFFKKIIDQNEYRTVLKVIGSICTRIVTSGEKGIDCSMATYSGYGFAYFIIEWICGSSRDYTKLFEEYESIVALKIFNSDSRL